jgi:hypothetical protein
MSLWSKQQFFCNTCGKELYINLSGVLGRDFKVCSIECVREMQTRYVKSMLNVEYEPFSQKFDENGKPIPRG